MKEYKEGGRVMGNKLKLPGFCLAGAVCLAAGIYFLFLAGSLKENVLDPRGRQALLETMAFFMWMLFFCCVPMKGWQRFGGIGFGILLGSWLHQSFLPLTVSGLWLLGIFMFGHRVGKMAAGEGVFGHQSFLTGPFQRRERLQQLAASFLIGSASWISMICLLSAFQIGGLVRIRKVAALLFLMLFAWNLAAFRGRTPEIMSFPEKESKKHKTVWEGVFLAVLITMVFLQFARVNNWPDYDSLHYGLRSPYILDNGKGIYENLGNINLVYTYPKGFEILSFPLSGTSTFGYMLCFNIWLTVLALILVYGLVFQLSVSPLLSLGTTAFVSVIPGIMNMSITAKSDTVTLVCQLCILCSAVGILVDEEMKKKQQWFGIAAGSCLLSFSMKPTSMVFSGAVSLTCLIYLLKKGGISKKRFFADRSFFRFLAAALIPAAGALFGTWIRTYRMTGVPTTSVFTSIWEKIGFSVRWPYAFLPIPNQGLELGAGQSLLLLARRLFGILIAPQGEDMNHVIIAWGSSLMVMFLLAWLLWGKTWSKQKKGSPYGRAWGCIQAAAAITGFLSLISVYLLWQVDGNYFMLLYVLLAVIGTLSLSEAKGQGILEEKKRNYNVLTHLFAGFLLFQTAVMVSTNWAGTVGFTPIKRKHQGYFNHQQALYEQMCSQGNQAIWSVLSKDPRARVIAVGEHPAVLQFPCNIQSYYDVTGSGGNVRLVKTLEDFKSFLRFAEIEYLYVQAGYLEEGTRCYDVVRFLVEDGSLGDIRYENGNMVACINLDGAYPVDPEWEAEEFYRNIRMKEP